MQASFLQTGRIAFGLALCLSLTPAAFAQTATPKSAVYGPKLEPAMTDPQAEPRDTRQQDPQFLVNFFKPLTPYEQSVSDWKNRQYRCMKKGSLCFESMPLPSDLLRAPSGR